MLSVKTQDPWISLLGNSCLYYCISLREDCRMFVYHGYECLTDQRRGIQSKRTKVEQEMSREKNKTSVFQTRKSRTPSAPRDGNVNMSTDRISKLRSTCSRNYCQRLMILRINKVNLIPVCSLSLSLRKGERDKKKYIHY